MLRTNKIEEILFVGIDTIAPVLKSVNEVTRLGELAENVGKMIFPHFYQALLRESFLVEKPVSLWKERAWERNERRSS
jgi:hypothetical protein